MAQKDLSTKILEDYNDVFADIYNVLLFEHTVIKADSLKNGQTESIYKDANDVNREQRRDIIKEYAEEANLTMSFLGIENQSSIDWTMPIRIMGYDYGSYKQQITDNKLERKLLPVITIVLNFASEKWTKGCTLYDVLYIPEVLKPFIKNYGCKVFDIAYLEDEVINQFTSDFKIVAKFCKSKRFGKEEVAECFQSTETLKYAKEVSELFFAVTKDRRYKEIVLDIKERQEKGVAITMCDMAEALEKRGIEKGMKQGMKQGRLNILFELLDDGDITIESAAKKVGMTEVEFLSKKEQFGIQN